MPLFLIHSRQHSTVRSRTARLVGLLFCAVISNSAISAAIVRSLTTLVVIAIAPNAKPQPGPSGCKRALMSCCPSSISMWSLPCRSISRCWRCVVPGGGLSADHTQWVACRKGFFLPVKVLSRLFRGKFIAYLSKAREDNQLTYAGQLSRLAEVDEFNSWLRELWQVEWVVYAKRPFGGPEQVLKYLARYTHRVAISNGRLLELTDNEVTFSYKDYAAGNSARTMSLKIREFARRFLLHVLPRGFVRIRYYGFLANGCRAKKLELCRRLLSASETEPESVN